MDPPKILGNRGQIYRWLPMPYFELKSRLEMPHFWNHFGPPQRTCFGP